MDKEQTKILEALQYAIQMEIDGKEYYGKASQKCEIKAGKELFEWLAEQEDWHRQKFEKIYKAIKDSKAWPNIDVEAGRQDKPITLFLQQAKVDTCDIKSSRSELNTIAKAMDMENKTHDFYREQGDVVVYEAQGKFYKALAAEERKHYLALVDYREYLIDPEGWFRKVEHHSLDGG